MKIKEKKFKVEIIQTLVSPPMQKINLIRQFCKYVRAPGWGVLHLGLPCSTVIRGCPPTGGGG